MGSKFTGFYNKQSGEVEWIDSKLIEDYRIQRRNNPVAPAVIQDTMDKLKHPGTGKYTESKAEFDRMSKETGLVPADFSPNDDFNRNGVSRELNKKEQEQIAADVEQASKRAYIGLRDGSIEVPEHSREYAKHVNESYEAATGKKAVIKGAI